MSLLTELWCHQPVLRHSGQWLWHKTLSDSKWLSASIRSNKQPSVTDIVLADHLKACCLQIQSWKYLNSKLKMWNWVVHWHAPSCWILMFIWQSYRQITSYWLQARDVKHIALTNSHHSYLESWMAWKAQCLHIYLLRDVRQPPTAVRCIKINTLNICWENIISCLSDLLFSLWRCLCERQTLGLAAPLNLCKHTSHLTILLRPMLTKYHYCTFYAVKMSKFTCFPNNIKYFQKRWL